MKPALALRMVAAAAALLPAAAAAQWQKNQYQLQKEAAARYEPAPFRIERRASGALTELRLRFYADGDYRAAGLNWQERMKGQLGALNRVVEPAFGVRFVAESFRRWDRGGQGTSLQPILAALERLDPGEDVDWVVGLVSPLPLVAMSFHDLGGARVLGRHFVVRGMSSLAEHRHFEETFTALDRAQRERLYGLRKAHKEQAVFLHEWAHTLGALHVEDPTRLMSPGYSHRTGHMTGLDAGAIAAALVARAAADGARVSWSPLIDYVRDAPGADWHPGDRAALLALAAGGAAPGSKLVAPAPPAPPPEAPPASLAAREVAALLGEGAVAEAAAVAARARAERGTLEAEIARARRGWGLPAGFVLPAADERAYAAAITGVRASFEAGDLGAARTGIEAGLRRWPRAPGLLVLTCELSLRQQDITKALRRCDDALARMPELPRAHLLIGKARLEQGKPEAALAPLHRALDLDDRDREIWDALGAAYRSLGRSQEFRKLLLERGSSP